MGPPVGGCGIGDGVESTPPSAVADGLDSIGAPSGEGTAFGTRGLWRRGTSAPRAFAAASIIGLTVGLAGGATSPPSAHAAMTMKAAQHAFGTGGR